MKCAERRAARRVTSLLLSLLWSLTLAGTLSAKSETVKMTIAGGDLARPVEVTESWILAKVNIWVGPGNTLNGVPDTRDGFVMWSEGSVKGGSQAAKIPRTPNCCKRAEKSPSRFSASLGAISGHALFSLGLMQLLAGQSAQYF